MRIVTRFTCYIFFLFLVIFRSPISAQSLTADIHKETRIVVRFLPEIEPAAFVASFNTSQNSDFRIFIIKPVVAEWNLYLIGYNPTHINPSEVAKSISSYSGILHAYPDQKVNSRAIPNDPNFSEQWNLDRISIEPVWDVTTGGLTTAGDTIVVAILDSDGFDINHPDLRDNIWINRGEISGDGTDNDGNGLIDDVHGWNFVSNIDTFLPGLHATSVAGIIGARGNNQKMISGINWDIKLMVFQTEYVSEVVAAYKYVRDQRRLFRMTNGSQGAFIVAASASFGIDRGTCDDYPEWGMVFDTLGAEGILSVSSTANSRINVDERGDMPTDCPSPFLVTVTNSNQQDRLDPSAAYGATTVDLAAPGENILTLRPNDQLNQNFLGASASCPHVAGAVALLYSLPCTKLIEQAKTNPSQTALTMKSILLDGVDLLDDFRARTVSEGRLNIQKSMEQVAKFCDIATGPLEILKIWPNPVHDILSIEYVIPQSREYTTEVFNAIGQLLFAGRFDGQLFGEQMTTLSIPHLASGVYILRLSDGTDSVIQSFIKH